MKAGMSGFEWLVTAYHLRASPFIKIDAELCIKILANADSIAGLAFVRIFMHGSASIFIKGDARKW